MNDRWLQNGIKRAGLRGAAALAVCLLCWAVFPAGASAEQPLPATHEELLQWRDEIWAKVRNQPVDNDPQETYDPTGNATYLIQLGNYTIESYAPTLDTEYNPIVSVTFNDAQAEGPRGTGLNMSAEEILATYQNDNPSLVGDEEFAALYVYDAQQRADRPEAAWGLAMRDARGLLNLEYAVCAHLGEADSYSNIIVSYVITDGLVSDMRISGFGDSILPEELRESIDTVRAIAADTSYDPEAGLQPPLHVEMFQRDDLVFSGMDFMTETLQSVRALFGDPDREEYVPTEEGGQSRLLVDYGGFAFAFEDERLVAMQITDSNFQGPRGLYVGDSLLDALANFRSEDPTYQDAILYAAGESLEQPPFGLLEKHSDSEATVRYATSALPDGSNEAVLLMVNVKDTRVAELYLYRWKVE